MCVHVLCACVCVHVHSACVRTCICTCVHVHVCVRCAEGGVYTVWRVIFGGSKFSDPDTRSHAERTLTRRLATPFDSANRVCALGGTTTRHGSWDQSWEAIMYITTPGLLLERHNHARL